MAGMTVNCRHHGCKRRVSTDNVYGPWCHDHRRYSETYAQANMGGNVTAQYEALIPKLDHGAFIWRGDAVSIAQSTGLDSADAQNVIESYDSWADGRDLSIPSEALDASQNVDQLVEFMEERGLNVRLAEAEGLHRQTIGGPVQRAGTLRHKVILMKSKSNEYIIDPNIAALAPVYDSNQPVDTQTESGQTPFGDTPWIGTKEAYTNGDWLSWDDLKIVSKTYE